MPVVTTWFHMNTNKFNFSAVIYGIQSTNSAAIEHFFLPNFLRSYLTKTSTASWKTFELFPLGSLFYLFIFNFLYHHFYLLNPYKRNIIKGGPSRQL